MNEDENRRLFVSRMKSRQVEFEQRLLGDHLWLAWGKRSVDTQELLDFVPRLAMGIFGGLALLVPMMIMVLNPTKLTSLVTTTVCVLFVAMAVAATMDEAKPKDVFAAVAAYTAVLAVFVGTSTTGSNVKDNKVVGAIAGGVLGGVVLLVCLLIGPFYYLYKRKEKKQGSLVGLDFVFS